MLCIYCELKYFLSIILTRNITAAYIRNYLFSNYLYHCSLLLSYSFHLVSLLCLHPYLFIKRKFFIPSFLCNFHIRFNGLFILTMYFTLFGSKITLIMSAPFLSMSTNGISHKATHCHYHVNFTSRKCLFLLLILLLHILNPSAGEL